MEFNDLLTLVIVPLVAAVLGGSLTVWGVILTIKEDNKIRKEDIRIQNEPLFYILDPNQDYDNTNIKEFDFKAIEQATGYIQILLKNTDKTPFVLEYVNINGKTYLPQNGTVVDKNDLFYLNIHTNDNFMANKVNKAYIAIKDVLNIEYKYRLNYSKEKNYFASGILIDE